MTLYLLSRFPLSLLSSLPFITSPSLQPLAHLSLSLDRKIKTLPFILRSPTAKRNKKVFCVGILLEIKSRRLYDDMHEKINIQLGDVKIQLAVAVAELTAAGVFDGDSIF